MQKLHASPTSPFARKVRAVAIEKGIELSLVMVAPPYVAVAPLNPLGKVPVLVREDGSVVFDSPVIVEVLDAMPSSAPSLLGEGETRTAIQVWQALADGMTDAIVTQMLEARRPRAQRSNGVLEHQQGKITRALEYAEARVGDAFLVDGRVTVADLALACALGYLDLRHPDPWRPTYPRLADFAQRLASRPSLATTAPPAA